jgi:sugar/nucleoside kinase (ribokinase family)
MVLVHGDGERSFIHYFGANATFRREDVDFARIQDSKILHFAGAFVLPAFDGEPMAELLRQARAADITTTLDTVWDAQGRWMSSLKPALPYVDYFLPSYDEARMLAGGRDDPTEIAQVLLDAGVYVVILKQGERGCYVRTRDDAFQIPAMNIPTVDELGAGDAFVSGFLTGLVKQWDLETCARFATAVGASCVQALGATTGIKSFGETLGLLPAVPQPIRGAA